MNHDLMHHDLTAPTPVRIGFFESTSNTADSPTALYPLRLWQFGLSPEPNPVLEPEETLLTEETVLIVHGRRDAIPDRTRPLKALYPRLFQLATELAVAPSTRVLFLDAGEALTDPALPPNSAAERIQGIANWAATELDDTANLTIIGHSLGSYIGAEIATALEAQQFIALDPAFPADRYDIDGLEPGQQSVPNFAESSPESLALVVADGFFQVGLAGDNAQAATAETSLVTQFDGLATLFDAAEAHSAVIDVATDLSRYLTPNAPTFFVLWNSFARDRYSNGGDRTNSGLHEGVAYADRDEEDLWRLEWIDGDGTNLYFVSDALGTDSPELDDDNGHDTLITLVDWQLEDGFENLILGGNHSLNGIGNHADNTLWGNAGANGLLGDIGDDVLWGAGGDDDLGGNAGADMVSGEAGDDHLIGGTANDGLEGGDGNDVLRGDRGHDHLYGGSGADIFVLQAEPGIDTIHDFDVFNDALGLSLGLTVQDLTFIQKWNKTVIWDNSNALARVMNINSNELTPAMFVTI